MRRSSLSVVKYTAGVLATLLLLAWAAPPASAAEVRTPSTRAPLSASVAARVAVLKPVPRAFQAPAPAAAPESKSSFLRSPTGVIAVVAMAAGLAIAVRSAFKDNEPVHSPIR